jgi:glycosyltransferase involved in cell wall biosynthesis
MEQTIRPFDQPAADVGSPVCCLCVTRHRPVLLARAIECFRRQTYPNRQLLIVAESLDDETVKVARHAAADPRIRLHLVASDSGLLLGELRNIAIEQAGTPLVAQWDDDDYSDSRRLEIQIQHLVAHNLDACLLAGAVVSFGGRVLFSKYRAWEGSLVCQTSIHPRYQALGRGEDLVVVERLMSAHRTALLNRPELYLYIFHGRNTWDRSHFEWVGYEGGEPAFFHAKGLLAEFFAYESASANKSVPATLRMNQYSRMFENLRENCEKFPAHEFSGRGVVIVAGGQTYLTCAWVCIHQLRRTGCTLPVELWHLGPDELNDEFKAIFQALPDVRCIDAFEVRKQHPMKTLRGWECKAFSILHSSFTEVLFLDADNMAVVNPTFLFNSVQYLETGAIFWPDVQVMEPGRPIWSLLDIPFRLEPEFESGQIVVDKSRCWKALRLTCHLSEFGHEFWWAGQGGGAYGDKDMFRFSWHSIDLNYAIPSFCPTPLDGYGVLCQRDFSGNRLFQHRTWKKWNLYEHNLHVDDFWFESECIENIRTLREKVAHARQMNQSPAALSAASLVVRQRMFRYRREGFDERLIEFNTGGLFGFGGGECEQWWRMVEREDEMLLEIGGRDGLLCALKHAGGLRFHGSWLLHERMPVGVFPAGAPVT